jgi:GH24 family phage-related lysozyme (muramidase)
MATQKPAANAVMQPSSAAYAALRRYEGARYEYYDHDGAGNCTWGVGTLAHRGPCTPEELRRTVTVAQVDAALAARVNEAAAAVRRAVNNQQLTQGQFDALVTYTYNRGATGAHPALQAANQGNNAEVDRIMNENVHAHPRDPQTGRPGPAQIAPGLVTRRREESAPFCPQPPEQ